MSLLLLFPSGSSTNFCWAVVSNSNTDWTISHFDFANLWSEWGTYTWGAITSSGLTWEGMAGFTFLNTTQPSTTWANVTLPVETC